MKITKATLLSDIAKIDSMGKVKNIEILDKATQTGKILRGMGGGQSMKIDLYSFFVNEYFLDKFKTAYSKAQKKAVIKYGDTYLLAEEKSSGTKVTISKEENEEETQINAFLGFLIYHRHEYMEAEKKTFTGVLSGRELAEYVSCLSDKYKMRLVEYEVNSSLISSDVFKQCTNSGEYTILGEIPTVEPTKPEKKENKVLNISPLNYDWGEEGEKRVPKISNYVPNSTYNTITKKISYRLNKVLKRMKEGEEDVIQNDYVNIALVGSPGVGKSVTIMAAAKALGMPIYLTSGSKFTEEDQFQGTNKVAGGKLNFYPTEFLNAFKYGGICLIEEMNLIDPGVLMGAIGQAIESPFILMEDGYKPVKRHPLCVIIGTMNTGTTGSRELNEALSSRFKQTYVMDEPKDKDFVDILCSKGYPKEQCLWVFEAYKKLRDTLCSPAINRADYCMRLTTRACFGVLENIEEGCEPKEALQTLFGKIAEVDLETTRSLEYLVDMLRDPIF